MSRQSQVNWRASRIAAWARAQLDQGCIILDTETTGLGGDAEIVQLAVVDAAGAVLLDTLVQPTRPIPPEATAIHGITDLMVAGAPGFATVGAQLAVVVADRPLIIYNANYDLRLIWQSIAAAGAAAAPWVTDTRHPTHPLPARRVECAMRAYAAYVGEWSQKRGAYRYQPLPGGDHSALGDARATLALLRRLAGTTEGDDVADPRGD